MGTLTYAGTTVGFDDRVLQHLQIVIVQKFRRGEAFLMSWLQTDDRRGSMWLTPAVPVLFTFEGSRVPSLDDGWVRSLSTSADGPRGLVVADADGQPIRIADTVTRQRAAATGHAPWGER